MRTGPGRWKARPDAVLSVVVPVAALAIMGYRRRWIADDGLINVRIVRNLLAGHGPVFNAGERVEAGTSFIWILMLGAAHAVLRVSIESLAVWGGLALSLIGMTAALLASSILLRPMPGRRLILPAGGLVVAALPPFWDFATSGLETGLTLAWAGLCVLGLVVVAERDRFGPVSLAVAALAGLAPLVRPDLALIGGVFLVALALLEWRGQWRRLGLLVVAGAAVPVLAEIFRLAFFGIVVPNTALAKEASRPRFGQGRLYLMDAIRPYWLVVPLVAVALVLAIRLWSTPADRRTRALIVTLAPVVGGLLHAAYVIVIGGDFMSGRLLLPAIFCFVAPAGLVAVPWPATVVDARRAIGAGLAAVAIISWAIACGTSLRLPYKFVGPQGIADERAFYSELSGHRHPTHASDYLGTSLGQLAQIGLTLHHEPGRVVCVVINLQCAAPVPRLDPRWPAHAALFAGNLGVVGAIVPLDIHIVDADGLADPVAGRIELATRGRPGHEKSLPLPWVYARFASAADQAPPPVSPGEAADARAALSCDGLAAVDRAVTEHFSWGRALHNVGGALGNTTLRFSADPATARRQLC
ncbi:MAG: arabinofuranosyltransferase [Acidimicrobiaceae bacterium]|nr:arabinofuranosyltransferase [Acidimicrobiaceae bacterium]